MKDRVPLDRRQFFQYLKLRATKPEVFSSAQMMRLDELLSCDRCIVEAARPSWKTSAPVVLTEAEVCFGGWRHAIEPEERILLEAIDGRRTIGELLAGQNGSRHSYEHWVRLLCTLLEAGALDLTLSKPEQTAGQVGETAAERHFLTNGHKGQRSG